jgi:hypothetical protein
VILLLGSPRVPSLDHTATTGIIDFLFIALQVAASSLLPIRVTMEPPDIRKVLGLLQEAGIPVCIVGELALNYYNAPRVIHVSPLP